MNNNDTVKLGEFAGAFKGFGRSAFVNARAFGISAKAAHAFGMAIMADVGRIHAENPECTLKVAKVNKDGFCSVKALTKGAARATKSLSLARYMEVIDGLYMEGLAEKRDLDNVASQFVEYIEKLEAGAEKLPGATPEPVTVADDDDNDE